MTRPRRLTAGCLAPTLKHLLCGPCQLWPARKRSSLRVYIHINTTVLMMFQVISSPWARLPRKSRLFYQLPDNEILTPNEAGCGNVRRWLYRGSVGGVWPRAITQVECLFSQWFLSLGEQHLRMISLHCNGAEPRRDTIGQTVRNSGRFGKQKHIWAESTGDLQGEQRWYLQCCRKSQNHALSALVHTYRVTHSHKETWTQRFHYTYSY